MTGQRQIDTKSFGAFAILIGIAMVAASMAGLAAIRWPYFGHAFAIGWGDIARVGLLTTTLILSVASLDKLAGPALGAVAPILVFGLTAVLAPFGPMWLSLALVVLLVAASVVLRGGSVTLGRGGVATALGLGAALGVMHLMVLSYLGYAQPLALEAALHGLQHRDTLFHATIASSLRETGIPSISLDGTVSLAYHVLSHWLVATLADWLEVSSLNAYSLFLPLVGVPFLIFLIMWCAATLIARPRRDAGAAMAQAGLVGWVVLAGVAGAWTVWVSESYIVSLWGLFAAILVMADAAALRDRRHVTLLLIALLPVLVVLTGMAKISVGAVLAVGVAVFVAALERWRPVGLALALLAGPVPFVALYLSSAPEVGSGESIIAPFIFLFQMPEKMGAHLIFAAILVFHTCRRWPTDPAGRAMALGLNAAMLSGIGAALSVNLPAGAALYFVNPGVLAGLMLVPALGLAPRWMLEGRKLRARLLLFVGLLFVILGHPTPRSGPERLEELMSGIEPGGTDITRTSPLGPLMHAAAGVDGVHVLSGPSAVWDLSPVCWTSVFAVQAIAGRPLLMSLPSADSGCEASPYYGFADYDAERSASRPMTDETLCREAAERNMVRLLLVGPELDFRVLDCDAS